MNLYRKIEKVIQEHILEHQEELFIAKSLLKKLDIKSPSEDYSYDLTSTGEKITDGYERKSIYWYDYNRNDLNRPNPFEIPDYTELPD
jgi:hypothetical protein